MKLAIEKASPLRGSFIFRSNFFLALRTFAMASSLVLVYYALTLEESVITVAGQEYQLTMLLLVAAFGLLIFGRRGFGIAYLIGLAARRLRYQGVVVYRRREPSEDQPEPLWFTDLPSAGFRNPNHLRVWANTVTTQLADTLPSVTYAQFVVGRDEDGDLRLIKVHACDDSAECGKPEIHLFGFDEKRDGHIWWGSA